MSKSQPAYVEPQGFFTPGRGRIADFDNDHIVLDLKTGELGPMPSMTKQSEMAACDINNIVREFTPSHMAMLIDQARQLGQYVDLPDSLDYQEGINTVLRAQEAFATLPAKVRSRFENDPAQFLEFFADPANQDEAIKLGLAKDLRPPPESFRDPKNKAEPEPPTADPEPKPKA